MFVSQNLWKIVEKWYNEQNDEAIIDKGTLKYLRKRDKKAPHLIY